ncbi:MAG: VWA domain-containing protein [Bryobacterales bacterium]|nr:VWA domain-containing protein [Bryobacterales bacterium]
MRLSVIWLALCPLCAQWPKFDVQTRLVTVPVAVTDAKGMPVEGLEAGAFELAVDGQNRKFSLDTFDTGVAPLALIVAVQTSGISIPVLEKVRKIGSMIRPVVTGERGCAGVIAFAERVEWRQQCTNNEDLLSMAFAQLQPGEVRKGRMLDAAWEGIRALRAKDRSRRVLVLISETRDRGSETDLETVVKEAETAAVTVYAITYSAFATSFTTGTTPVVRLPTGTQQSKAGRYDPHSPPYLDRERPNAPPRPPPEHRVDLGAALEELARLAKDDTTKVLSEVTGGAVFGFGRQKGLEDAIQKLGLDVHTQYVLSFVPEKIEIGYHRISVKVKMPLNSVVRTRPGFWMEGAIAPSQTP